MIFDTLRNEAYRKAIKAHIKPGDTVLDLGAGLGILGLMALQHGAGKVYMVDPSPVINIAERLIQQNKFTNSAVILQSSIETCHIPEQVDCILSVFTGNFLLSEDLLPSLIYARNQYLKPAGCMLPDKAIMHWAPVSAKAFYADKIDAWQQQPYGIDFSAVRPFTVNETHQVTANELAAEYLSESAALNEMDFCTAETITCDAASTFEISQSGTCHGLVGWFDARLNSCWLSTSPQQPAMHWSQIFLPLTTPIELQRGDQLQATLNRPEFGHWTWSVSTQNHQQRQSSFLSTPVNPQQLKKMTDNYQPRLNNPGNLALQILEMLNGDLSTSEIISQLSRSLPPGQQNKKTINTMVRRLIMEYTGTEPP